MWIFKITHNFHSIAARITKVNRFSQFLFPTVYTIYWKYEISIWLSAAILNFLMPITSTLCLLHLELPNLICFIQYLISNSLDSVLRVPRSNMAANCHREF